MASIPQLRPITTPVRPLNSRLWELVAKESAGTATRQERAELDALFEDLEAAGD